MSALDRPQCTTLPPPLLAAGTGSGSALWARTPGKKPIRSGSRRRAASGSTPATRPTCILPQCSRLFIHVHHCFVMFYSQLFCSHCVPDVIHELDGIRTCAGRYSYISWAVFVHVLDGIRCFVQVYVQHGEQLLNPRTRQLQTLSSLGIRLFKP